jgi:hypothetical protein
MMIFIALALLWFLIAVVMLVVAGIAALFPSLGLEAILILKVFGVWLALGMAGGVVAIAIFLNRVRKAAEAMREQLLREGIKIHAGPVSHHFNYVLELVRLPDGTPRKEEPGARELRQEFLNAGFVDEGDFDQSIQPEMRISGFTHAGLGVHGKVITWFGKGCWAEVEGRFDDGEFFAVSNTRMPQVLKRIVPMKGVVLPGASVVELMKEYEEKKPAMGVMAPTSGGFKKRQEIKYWQLQSRVFRQGGINVEEMKAIQASGLLKRELKDQLSAETATEFINDGWRKAWEALPQTLVERWIKAERRPHAEAGRFIGVFEGLTTEEFMGYLMGRLGKMGQENGQGIKGFNPRLDGHKLLAAAQGAADGMAGARAIAQAHPDWFREVHRGDHPMNYALYELVIEERLKASAAE